MIGITWMNKIIMTEKKMCSKQPVYKLLEQNWFLSWGFATWKINLFLEIHECFLFNLDQSIWL